MLPLQIHRREKEVKRHYMAKNRISDLLVFFLYLRRSGIPNLGDAIGSQVVVFWVQLDQWGDVIDVWGDGEAKRLGTPNVDDHLPSINQKTSSAIHPCFSNCETMTIK
jgi:hypothetical protein